MDNENNAIRIGNGLDIYSDAMGRYITQQIQLRVSSDGFRERAMNVLHPSRQEEIAEALQEGKKKEEVLEFKDFPEVIRQNRKVFPSNLAGGRRKKSIAVTWMQEITEWRNNWAHPPRDGFSDQDADRALETCARVLQLVDPVAEKKVRELFRDPQDLKQELKDEQANHKDTQRGANKAEDLKKQLNKERDDHRNTRQRLKDAKKLKSTAEEGKQKAEGALQRLMDVHNTTKQKLKAEQDGHNETKKKLKLTEESKAPAEQSQKPSDPQVQAKFDAYRENFHPAKSGNGRRRPILLWEDKDWYVTHWVGEVRGKSRACVFAPWKSSDSGWIKAGDEPLIDLRCDSEDDAFAKLWERQQSGEIERRAREAIEDYDDPDDSDDLYVSDDDIPF